MNKRKLPRAGAKAGTTRRFRPEMERDRICRFISGYVKKSGVKGVVVGLSGGVDSSVVATLCKRAIGAGKVTGVYLFEDSSRKSKDFEDAVKVASGLRIKTLDVNLSPIVESVQNSISTQIKRPSRVTMANVKARCRMTVLYSIANQIDLLVAGTGDRSETLLGYFTKWGDGGVDFLPIAHLYKSEVRALGAELRIPATILAKPSSPNLWPGQKATDELPADYDVLDRVLTLLYDSKLPPKEVAKRLSVSYSIVRNTILRHRESEHKREMPPSLA